MTLDQRLNAAARQIADGLVTPEVDLESVRASARRNRRRTAAAAILASAAAVVTVVVVATTLAGREASSPTPLPGVTPTATPTSSPSARPWTPALMTPRVVVESVGAAPYVVGVAPDDTDVRISLWTIAGYRGMALTTNGYQTTTYARVPKAVSRLVSIPRDGFFLLSDGNDKEWLVDVSGKVTRVTRADSTFTPTDPRLWYQCVAGSWRSRWCSLDLKTATAHVSSEIWAGSAVRPGLGVQPWGANPEPRSAYLTGRLEAWWYTAEGRQTRTIAEAHDGDYLLGAPLGEMAFWAPGKEKGTLDIHVSHDGGARWSVETRAAPGPADGARRLTRSADGSLLMCTAGASVVISRAEAGGGPFRRVFTTPTSGDDPCAGFGTQGKLAFLYAGDTAATSRDNGRTWAAIDTWRSPITEDGGTP